MGGSPPPAAIRRIVDAPSRCAKLIGLATGSCGYFARRGCIYPAYRLVECERAHDIRILRLWEDGIGPG
jgi:hypothetical protein